MTNFVQPYNPDWKTAFENLKQILGTALEGMDTDIQHAGSTSVPGLSAKPVVDIDIIIDNKILIGDISARLEKLGYRNKGEQGIAGRLAFRQTSAFTPVTVSQTKWPSHHLYVCFSDSLALKNHLQFRDALLKDRKLVDAYSALKMTLTNEENMTREAYAKQKTGFIISVLAALGFETGELNEIRGANA